MKIAFFSNNLNIHQVELADEFAKINTIEDFVFVETRQMTESRNKMGFKNYDRPYKISINEEDKTSHEKAIEIAKSYDVAIIGAASEEFLKIRLKNKLMTFSYSERWMKRGLINVLSPTIIKLISLYINYGRKAPWYVLCASAFLSKDLKNLCMFKNRCYKWGYFTKVEDIVIDEIIKKRNSQYIKILWVGRFISWKHPEKMIKLAKLLIKEGHKFIIRMVGDGYMKAHLQNEVNAAGIQNYVQLLGNMSNESVKGLMRDSHILCTTSNKQEGWGAVLNEAMASGCCPIASEYAGSSPYLINNGENGFLYNPNNNRELYEKIVYLINHRRVMEEMSKLAYFTMRNNWNAQIAVSEFMKLVKSLSKNKLYKYTNSDGPCSNA